MRPRTTLFALLLLILLPEAALAQGSARSLDLDPSIRSSGMGGASGAVFWGGDANYWANPALLGYHRGLRYEYGRTQLVPDLAEGVIFRTSRFSAGLGGIGVASAGKPDGRGYLRLDYGLSMGTDEQGNPTGTFDSREEISMFGVGASLSGLVSSAFRAAGANPPLLFQMLDVAAGYAEKDVRVVLGPGPFSAATATTKDWGVLGRLTIPLALDSRTGTAPARIEAAVGHSIINYNDDATLVFLTQPDPTSRTYRTGASARLAIDLPKSARRALRARDRGWLTRGLDPYVSIGGAYDREAIQAGSDLSTRYNVDRWGVELALANIVSMRYGHVRDVLGDIDGSTWGVGLGLDLGFAGFRWDHAEIPQARGLSEVKREGWTAYVDPVVLLASVW
jgi:hypothetical protein